MVDDLYPSHGRHRELSRFGRRFGCDFTYRVQEEAGGIADALSLAGAFSEHDRIVVLLGDNSSSTRIAPHVDAFRKQSKWRARFCSKKSMIRIVWCCRVGREAGYLDRREAGQPKSNYAVIGCYMFDDKVFDLIRDTDPRPRAANLKSPQ